VKRLVLRATLAGVPAAGQVGATPQGGGRGGGAQAAWIDARLSGVGAVR